MTVYQFLISIWHERCYALDEFESEQFPLFSFMNMFPLFAFMNNWTCFHCFHSWTCFCFPYFFILYSYCSMQCLDYLDVYAMSVLKCRAIWCAQTWVMKLRTEKLCSESIEIVTSKVFSQNRMPSCKISPKISDLLRGFWKHYRHLPLPHFSSLYSTITFYFFNIITAMFCHFSL